MRRTIAATWRSWSTAGSSVSSTLPIRSRSTLQFSWKTASSTCVLGVEVVVEEPVRDARLLRDVADPARVESLAREHANGGVENLPPLVLRRCRTPHQGGEATRLA